MKRKLIYKIFALTAGVIIILVFSAKKATVIVEGREKEVYTSARAYETMLDVINVDILPEEEISVPLNRRITNKSILSMIKSKKISIDVDNNLITFKTTKTNWEEALKEKGITYDDNDIFSKNIKTSITNNDKLVITRVDVKQVEEVEYLPFDEKVVRDYKAIIGETRLVSDGILGQKKNIYNVIYNNGVEVTRDLIAEEEKSAPVSKIIAEGIFDPNSITVCVNKKRYLADSFEPDKLVVPNVRMASSASKNMLRPEAASALESLFDAAENEGVYLYAVSGYRSYYYQSTIYNPYSGYSAPPGASEHQLGIAMDVNTGYSGTNLTANFAYTKEGQWVRENAHKYGFVIRYLEGKEDITGYYFEPWHLRYLGVELATELTDKCITLEEYYGEY